MWQSERGYLINQATWSSYMSFVFFLGLTLVASLPSTSRVVSSSPTAGFPLLFTMTAILLFGILSMNFGQEEIEWSPQFKDNLSLYHRHLLSQVGFLLFLMLPHWVVYQGVHHLNWVRFLWGLAHLFVFGLAAGFFGLFVGLRAETEISQFNIKYAVFLSFMLLTALWEQFRPLNPFIALAAIFGDTALDQSVWFFVQSYLGFGVLLGVLFWFTRRQIFALKEA